MKKFNLKAFLLSSFIISSMFSISGFVLLGIGAGGKNLPTLNTKKILDSIESAEIRAQLDTIVTVINEEYSKITKVIPNTGYTWTNGGKKVTPAIESSVNVIGAKLVEIDLHPVLGIYSFGVASQLRTISLLVRTPNDVITVSAEPQLKKIIKQNTDVFTVGISLFFIFGTGSLTSFIFYKFTNKKEKK